MRIADANFLRGLGCRHALRETSSSKNQYDYEQNLGHHEVALSECRRVSKNQELSSLNTVVCSAVVPQDFPLVFFSKGQLKEALHCLWILCVHMRKVGGEDQPVITDEIDSVFHRLFVGFDGGVGLSLEIETGWVL